MRHTVAILETIARGHVAILENDEKFVTRYPSRMLSEWLRNAMKAAGMSQAQLARELTDALGRSIDRAAVNKMLSNGRKISADELVAITRILNTDAPSDPAHPAPDLRTVTVAAHVQAGYWSESWEWPDEDQYQVAVPNDEHLKPFRLYAAETRGPSMNRRWPEGTVVVFTNAAETLESPVLGKRYVVERRRSGETEHTVKLLHKDENGRLWLVPESTDPLHQQPIPVEDTGSDEDHVVIIGRVWFSVGRE
jgi:transcriptional regulator with XRE-family HTH domain